MRQKEIEKIPYRTAESCGEKYNFVARAFTEEIKTETHLFVEIYPKTNLQIPSLRMIFTRKDWALYYPAENVWSKAGMRDEYERNIWEDSRKRRDEETFISQEEDDLIWDFSEDMRPNWRGRNHCSWTDCLDEITDKVKSIRSRRREKNRAERLKDRIANTPPLPDDLEAWADNRLFPMSHFLYYQRDGRYVTIACSACGQVSTIATKRKETYEGQYESVMDPPKNNLTGRCPHCGAIGTWKAKGKTKGVYALDKYCFVGQPYKDTGAVIRYIQIEKIYRLEEAGGQGEQMMGASENYIITEIARRYLVPGKKAQTDYHKCSNYSGVSFWDDCNLYMGGIGIKSATVYEKTYQFLENTVLKYSGAKEYALHMPSYNLMNYMERYLQYPQIEMFSKAGLYGVVEKMINGYCGLIVNQNAKKPENFLGIYKHRMKDLIRSGGDTEYLRAMRIERRMDAIWREKDLILIKQSGIEYKDLELVLEYTTMKKLTRHLERYAGCEIPETMDEYLCSSACQQLKNKTRTYFDYLNMRDQRGYDLNNSIFLFPENLREAHDQMVREVNEAEIKKREAEVKAKYGAIAERYRKLRNRYYYEDDHFLIRTARSAEEIIREGQILHHCVGGDNYLRKHGDGTSYILFLRKKEDPEEPYITIEIMEKKIIQWYGMYDKKPDEKIIQSWLDRYIERLEDGIRNINQKEELRSAG